MSRFSLGLEGQEQDLELEHDSRDIEYESVADSHLSPAAGRAFNNAIDDSESLSRMNDVLENSDIEDIPESSRVVIQTSMESIRARLLGGTQQRGVAVEGFSNSRQLQVAIEKNKGIIASVWDAIINFFKGIYNFIAGFFGKSSKNNSNLSSDVSTLKQVASAKVEEPSKTAKKAETAKTERELDALEIFCQQQLQDINKQGSKLDSLNLEPIHVVKKDEETKDTPRDAYLRNLAKIDIVKIELKSYEKSFNDAQWYEVLETSNFNNLLNPSVASEKIVKINLDEEIYSTNKAISYLSDMFSKNLKEIFTRLEVADKYLDQKTIEDKNVVGKINSLSNLGSNNKSLLEFSDALTYVQNSLSKNNLSFRFGEKVTDSEKRLFEITEHKKNSSLVTVNFSNLQKAISEIQELNKTLSDVKPLIERVQSKVEKLKIEDFGDKAEGDNPHILSKDLSSYKLSLTETVKNFNKVVIEIVKVVSQGNNLLKAYSRIIKQLAKEKNKVGEAAFLSIGNLIKEKRKELEKLKEEHGEMLGFKK